MSIFINSDSKVIVQGMTGSEGTKHTGRMLKSGTNIVGGVTPGKGGQAVEIEGKTLPVFNSVAEAIAATGANASVAGDDTSRFESTLGMAATGMLNNWICLSSVFQMSTAHRYSVRVRGESGLGLLLNKGSVTFTLVGTVNKKTK